ncbi:hypothetical protein K491DRAFT_324980 [Lophiostoma macrostomum CBS 122681]|uniref:Uncharacterized protein n=1 Tax=Lophiostoma macrostomum CBS 122681 TaxID=1314788 RepID=A0A6A6TE37_9PLEO|nr:hypothetical protein K491DRAFT_324980 [Lophiostoma macrostomum CBS 122681]
MFCSTFSPFLEPRTHTDEMPRGKGGGLVPRKWVSPVNAACSCDLVTSSYAHLHSTIHRCSCAPATSANVRFIPSASFDFPHRSESKTVVLALEDFTPSFRLSSCPKFQLGQKLGVRQPEDATSLRWSYKHRNQLISPRVKLTITHCMYGLV